MLPFEIQELILKHEKLEKYVREDIQSEISVIRDFYHKLEKRIEKLERCLTDY
jgi:hypothetical protein